ncbi:MAG: hypothetical protein P9L97_06000 [Candidatus Tenebribacter davisii]|nr:hypothetical protein [Candidatus Tenebribacter davisii]
MSITLVKIPNPFQPEINKKEYFDFESDRLHTYLKDIPFHHEDINFVVAVNGVFIVGPYQDVIIEDHAIISVTAKVEATGMAASAATATISSSAGATGVITSLATAFEFGGIAGAVAYASVYVLTSFVIGYGMSMLASLLAPDIASEETPKTVYSWALDGVLNQEGINIPLIYGKNRLPGLLLNSYLSLDPIDKTDVTKLIDYLVVTGSDINFVLGAGTEIWDNDAGPNGNRVTSYDTSYLTSTSGIFTSTDFPINDAGDTTTTFIMGVVGSTTNDGSYRCMVDTANKLWVYSRSSGSDFADRGRTLTSEVGTDGMKFLSPPTNDAHDDFLHIQLGLGIGPVDTISDLYIDAQNEENYSDENVSLDYRLGTATQDIMEGFDEVTETASKNEEVLYAEAPLVMTTPGVCDKVNVVVAFPNGVWNLDKTKGGIYKAQVSYSVEYKATTDPDTSYVFKQFQNFDEDGDPYTVLHNYRSFWAASRTEIKHKIVFEDLARDQYDIRVTKLTVDSEVSDIMNTLIFSYVQGVYAEILSYPGLAMYSVAIKASTQFSGGIPQVSVSVDKKTLSIWDKSSTPYWDTTKLATNPAWLVWDLICNKAGISKERLIWEDFKDWADYCDENVADSGDLPEKRFEVNIIISEGNFWDNIQKVAKIGRAAIIRRGYDYGVFIDKWEGTTPVVSHVFNSGNIIEDSFELHYIPSNDRANIIEVEYSDADQEYTRQIVSAFSSDYLDEDKIVRKAVITIDAAISQAQAMREAVYRINSNVLLNKIITFDAFSDSFTCVVGDLFHFQHEDVSYNYQVSGRIVSATQYTVTLDQEVELIAGISYNILIRIGSIAGDNNNIYEKQITNVPGLTSELTLLSAAGWDTIPEKFDLFTFGEVGTYDKIYKITGVTGEVDSVRTITGGEYVPEIFTNNDAEVITDNIRKLKIQKAMSVIVNEFLAYNPDGSFSVHAQVVWSQYFSHISTIWEVWMSSISENANGTSSESDPAKIRTGRSIMSIEVKDILETGITYKFYINVKGQGPYDHGTNTKQITIAGLTAPPADISVFAATWNPVTLNVEFSWTEIGDIDLEYYFIREGVAWLGGDDIVWPLKGNATVNLAIPLTGDLTEKTYWMKGVDTTGNPSAIEAQALVGGLAVPLEIDTTVGTVLNFDGEWDIPTHKVKLTWDAVLLSDGVTLNPHIDRYEIYHGFAWATSVKSGPYPSGDVTEIYFDVEEGTNGNRTYWIRAVDTAGNYADIAGTPPVPHSSKVVAIDTSLSNGMVPVGLTATSDSIINEDGTNSAILIVSCTAMNLVTYPEFLKYSIEITNKTESPLKPVIYEYPLDVNTFTFPAIPNTSYGIRIRSVDIRGNFFDWSTEFPITSAYDTTAPAVPTGLTATSSWASIVLTWTITDVADLSHFVIYRRTVNSSPGSAYVIGQIAKSISGTASMYIDSPPTSDSYYYWVRSVDRTGNTSTYSASAIGQTGTINSMDNTLASVIAMEDDQVLSVTEKSAWRTQWVSLESAYDVLIAFAASLSVSSTTFAGLYTTLHEYLRDDLHVWDQQTVSHSITGTALTSKTTAYFDEFTTLTNACNEEAKVSTTLSSLTNDSCTVTTYADGSGGTYSTGNTTTTMQIFTGTTLQTGWSFSKVEGSGLNATLGSSSGICVITSLTDATDESYVTITASKSGYSNQTSTFTISKSKTGAEGTPLVNRWLTSSVGAIGKSEAGDYNPTTITFYAWTQTGEDAPTAFTGGMRVYENTTLKDYGGVPSITRTPSPTGVDSVTCKLYTTTSYSVLLDTEGVPVVFDGDAGVDGTDGTNGTDGSDGIDGRTVNITATDYSIEYNIHGNTPNPSTIPITATKHNSTGDAYYNFEVDGVTKQHTTSNTYTYSCPSSISGDPQKITVELREDGTGTSLLATDETTIAKLQEASGATTITLSNPAHTMYTDFGGANLDVSGSGNDIKVWIGTTPIPYDGTSSYATPSFRISTAVTTGLVIDSPSTISTYTRQWTNITSMSETTSQVTYTVTVVDKTGIETEHEVTQSLSQSPSGDTGDNAQIVRVTGNQSFKYLDGATDPTETTITLTATLSGELTTYDWEYWNGSSWTNLSGTQTSATYSLLPTNAAWGSDTSLRVRCLSGTIFDEISIAKLYDGTNTVSGYLTNPSSPLSALYDGTGYSLTTSGGTFKVFKGITDVTTSSSFAGTTTKNGLTFTINSSTGVYVLTGGSWTSDSETFTATATYEGTVISKVYTISKAKMGDDGTNGKTYVLNITGGSRTFTWDSAGTSYTPGPATALTAELREDGVVVAPTYAWTTGGTSVGLISGSGSTSVFTPTVTNTWDETKGTNWISVTCVFAGQTIKQTIPISCSKIGNVGVDATNWSSDIVFTSTDHNDIAWAGPSGSTGRIDSAEGSYTGISGGTKLGMTTGYYVYFDPTSSTILKTTTSPATAVGIGNVILAYAINNPDGVGTLAILNVFGGTGGSVVAADQVTANSISAISTNVGVLITGVIQNPTGTFVINLTNGTINVAKAEGLTVNASGGLIIGNDGDIIFQNSDAIPATDGILENKDYTAPVGTKKVYMALKAGPDGEDYVEIPGIVSIVNPLVTASIRRGHPTDGDIGLLGTPYGTAYVENLTIVGSGKILPTTNGSCWIGDSTHRFDNGYINDILITTLDSTGTSISLEVDLVPNGTLDLGSSSAHFALGYIDTIYCNTKISTSLVQFDTGTVTGVDTISVAKDGTYDWMDFTTDDAIILSVGKSDSGNETVYAYNKLHSVGNLSTGGDLDCTGTASANVKAFLIDHPLDPENKLLRYSSIEGPKCDLIHRGTVKMVNGFATVDIDAEYDLTPGTFEALCQDSEVTSLITKNSFERVKSTSILGSVFTIESESNEFNGDVNWVVIGERKDPAIRIADTTDETGHLINEVIKSSPLETALDPITKETNSIEKSDVIESEVVSMQSAKGYYRHPTAYGKTEPTRNVTYKYKAKKVTPNPKEGEKT